MLISQISKAEHIPKKFLEVILLDLKNKGFLLSKKGKGGGYSLAKSAEKITLGEVVRALDGPIAPVTCVSQTAYQPCKDCVNETFCGIRMIMGDVREAISGVLDHVSFKDIQQRIHKASLEEGQISSYCI